MFVAARPRVERFTSHGIGGGIGFGSRELNAADIASHFGVGAAEGIVAERDEAADRSDRRVDPSRNGCKWAG